uniref:tRNA-splicing endonuclease subunit Sen15-like n=1 Tax=Sinocyclocheilus rhinocerous TaxID=307959 RepID=A0A673FSE0_9TELE
MDEVNRADPPNWIQQHAVYQDLMHLDVGDSAQVYAAFLVYMDLTEVRKWKEVVGVSCPELQAVLLEGREKEGETVQMIYPLPSHRSIKHRDFYDTFMRPLADTNGIERTVSKQVSQRDRSHRMRFPLFFYVNTH